ncbi:hypothetical protein [Sphingobium ummariense]
MLSLIASTLFASAASAAQTSGITYDCDTAADHFSELVLPVPDGAFLVSGHLQVNQIPPVGKYVPLTRISVAQAPGSPGQPATDLAGFVLTALPAKMIDPKSKDSKLVVQFLKWDERTNNSAKEHDPFGVAAVGEKLDFSLAFSAGTVTARIAGQEQRFTLNAPTPIVRLICSTGEFLYTDLKIEKSN